MKSEEKQEIRRVLVSFGALVCLILLLIWLNSQHTLASTKGSYKPAWQPCPKVDTTFWYLEGADTTVTGEIPNAVGCPVEIDEYVNFRPVVEHSKIVRDGK